MNDDAMAVAIDTAEAEARRLSDDKVRLELEAMKAVFESISPLSSDETRVRVLRASACLFGIDLRQVGR